jgi:hypothetical protein
MKLALQVGGTAGTANCWCCGTSMLLWPIVGLWRFGLHPSRFSSGLRASRSYGQRFCDRLRRSKQTAATAGVICGPKLLRAQCFRGVRAQTWRANDHGGGAQSWRDWPSCFWGASPERGRDLAENGGWAWAGAAEAGDRRGRHEVGGFGGAAFAGASPNWRSHRIPARNTGTAHDECLRPGRLASRLAG